MPSLWEWSDSTHRYRDTRTGRFIGQATMVGMRDQFIERQKQQMDSLGSRLAEGRIDTNQWLAESREIIKQSFVAEYILGHGGRNSMTPSDWGKVGAMAKKQYGFLQGFAQDVQNGMSEAAIKARSNMYVEAATQAFERGKADDLGLPRLPQYPADGGTRCLSNCKCSLKYERVEGGWEITWDLGVAEHCEDCVRLAGEWNPLRITSQGYAEGIVGVPYSPEPEHVGEVRDKALAAVERMAAQQGVSVAEAKELIAGSFDSAGYMNAPLQIRLTIDSMDKVLEEGRLKTLFETGRSGSAFNPEQRKATEALAFGAPVDMDVTKRPVYAYVHMPDKMAYDGVQGYGEISLVLKDEVKQRATTTVGDSLGAGAFGDIVGVPFADLPSRPEAWGRNPAALLSDKWSFEYVEAQVHGGVKLEDVGAVYFNQSTNWEPDLPSWATRVPAMKRYGELYDELTRRGIAVHGWWEE